MKILLALLLLNAAATNLFSQIAPTAPVLPAKKAEKTVSPLNDLYRDFIFSGDNVVLEHSLPNGKWRVTINMGQADSVRNGMQVKAEGESVGPDIDSTVGQFSFVDRFGGSDTPTAFEVDVADGSLTLEFGLDSKAHKKYWVLNRMSIENISATGDDGTLLASQFHYDFGSRESPVQPGFEKVTPSESGRFTFSAKVKAKDRRTITNQFPDGFLELDYPHAGERYGDRVFHYRLHEPSDRDKGASYPLIVWLHGYDDSGDDNQTQLRWLRNFLFTPRILKNHQFYLLAVQCPSDDRDWSHPKSDSAGQLEDMADICSLICKKTIQDYPIDEDRVYLTGLSSGGTGSWNLGARYPELFAAVIPLASPGGDGSDVSNLSSVPVWAFTNLDDRAVSIEAGQQYVDRVNAAGGNAYITGLDAPGHIANPFRYPELEVVEWMFAKRRGDSAWWLPPGSQPSRWPIRSAFDACLSVVKSWMPVAKYWILAVCCFWLFPRLVSKSAKNKKMPELDG